METSKGLISPYKKFERRQSLEAGYRLATVKEAQKLLETSEALPEADKLQIRELLPQSENEALALRDGYLFDFGAIRTFYWDMEDKFLLKYKLGVAQYLPEEKGESLCLPLALLHACAEEDFEMIRDLVMDQSVYSTYGRKVPEENMHEEKEVESRSMNRGFFLLQDPDGRIRSLTPEHLIIYSALWGSSTAGMGENNPEVAAGNDATAGQPPQAQANTGSWPPPNSKRERMSPSGARRALLHAFTAWPKKGGTALHFAAATGRSEVVDFLLDLEVEILFSEQRAPESADAAELDSYTSLSQELLLNVVDGDGNNPLCCAAEAEKDNSAVVQSLLDVKNVRGFDRDKLIKSLVETNKFGVGALLIAASKGHINTLYCLLEQAFGPFLNEADWVDIMYIADTSRNKDCLESNNLFHYCVERAKIDEFRKVLVLLPTAQDRTAHDQQADWHLIAEGMLVASSNFDINALELALQRGRSDICELFLEEMIARIHKRDTEIIFSGLEYIFRSNSNVDSRCNNVLHRYALGGGSTETGRLLIELLELSAKWLSEAYGSGRLARTMIRIWDWQPEGPSIVAALISQLNCAGETPCITALKRGHKDALQALLPFWDKKLVLQYRNPVEQGDTFLHCYAKSKAGFDLFSLQELPSELQGCTASLVTADHPFTMRNWQGHTPMLSALYSAQTVSFRCLLKQRKPLEGQVQQSNNALHVYAYCCDDEQAGSELIEGLGKEQVKAEIGKSIQLELEPTAADARPITDQQVGPFKIKGTPLMLAIAGGNLQACKAIKKGAKKHNMKLDELLDISFNQSMDAESGNNVLHFLCTNMKSGSNLQEFWNILTQPSKVATTSDFAEKLINAGNKAGETPLIRALKVGNTTAAEWLLLQADKYSEQKEPDIRTTQKKEAEYIRTARAVFSAFLNGSCRQLGLWKKLKAIYCRPPMSPSLAEKIANSALRESILKEISTNSQEILQSVTKDDSTKNLLAEENLLAEDGSQFWSSYLDNVSNLDNIAILIVMKRNMRNFKAPNQKDCFREALKKGNLKLFEMALQGKTYNYFKEEFNKDQYESFLRHFFMGDSNYKLSLFLIQELCVEKCSSPKVTWKRFLRLVDSNYAAVGAWTWAVANLMERPWQGPVQEPRTSVPEILEDVAAEMRTHLRKTLMQFVKRPITDPRAVQQQRQYSSAAKIRDTRSVLLDVCFKLLPSLLAGESDRNGRTDTRQDLLKEVEEDHPSLVYFLLRSGAFLEKDASSGLSSTSDLTGETAQPAMADSARLLQLVYTYSRRGFLGNLDVVLEYLFDEILGGRRSDKKAALSKPVDIEYKDGRRSIKAELPILIACALHCPLATLIKVLSVAQFCKAERMVDKEGYTSLHRACESNKLNVVIALTTMCPNLLDRMTSDGRTPLLVAARQSPPEIVEHLLSLTKSHLSFIRDIHGRTALYFAATSTRKDSVEKVVKMLWHRAERDEDQALLLYGTDLQEVKELLTNVEKKSPSELLQLAVEKENWAMVKDLINKGAKLTSTLHQDVRKELGISETKQLDQPNTSDSLGRGGLAKGIASLFLNPFAALPMTVGVLGSWGMGKSSIMLQTQIYILMTLVERNILPSGMDSQSLGQNSQTKLEKLHYKVLQAKKNLTSQRLNESASKHKVFWKWWPSSKQENGNMQKDIESFVSEYRSNCISLYKGLALMSRCEMFQYHSVEKQHQEGFQTEMPPCLTIYYNAWLYHGESDASSGLALTIMQELEACLSTAQWLELCWNYACRSNPLFRFTNMYLPLLVLLAIGGIIVWITWEFLSIPSIANHEPWSKFKYGSIPMTIIVTLCVILKKILNFARPVSMQILQSTYTSKKYKSKTGFHQEIINDIQFFKDHLGKKVGLGWKIIGKVWSLLFDDVDNISRSSIKKFQTLEDELRIIVFIDDLDRCVNPDYIIELLGATNLILSTCGISAVLGMDKDIVSSILQNKDIYDVVAVEKFLEKVINIPIDLYEPSGLETSHFLGDQLMFAKSKESKPFSTSSNQKSFNVFERQDETTPNQPANTFSISQYQRLPQEMDYGDPQCSQVCANLYLQEDSTLDLDSNYDFKEIVIVEEKAKSEDSKIVISNMQHEESTPSESIKLHDQHKTSVLERKQCSNSQQEGYKKERNKLLVQFPLSLTNYNEAEVKIFRMLQGSAKTEQKKPRNLKRLLSYHQLVRSILLESKKDMLDPISGWQGQLIIWLFVCYNWKERMNDIFKEDWKDLFVIGKQRLGVKIWPSLHKMVVHQRQKHEKLRNLDLKDEWFQRVSKDWRELEETLYGGFDVEMESIKIFQYYRFHCNIGHMQWGEVRFD